MRPTFRPHYFFTSLFPLTIHLLVGPIHSGKTTRLTNWCATRTDAAGILSPLRTDGRTFVDIRTGATVPMELGAGAPGAIRIGRYAFAPEAFTWANEHLLAEVGRSCVKWLVVDEIGPLELRGEALDPGIRRMLELAQPDLNLVLVVREGLEAAVTAHYDLTRWPVRHFAA